MNILKNISLNHFSVFYKGSEKRRVLHLETLGKVELFHENSPLEEKQKKKALEGIDRN